MKKNDIKPGNVFEFDNSNKFNTGKFAIIFIAEDEVYWYIYNDENIYHRSIRSMTTIKANLIGNNFPIYSIPEYAKIKLFDSIWGQNDIL